MTIAPGEFKSAWRGDELLARDDWLHEFTTAELAELDRAIANVGAQGREIESLAATDLPLAGTSINARLAEIQRNLEHGSGACLLKGLQIESRSEDACRRLFWAIATQLGTPVSQSAAGERIFSVRDEGFKIGPPPRATAQER